MEQHRRALCWDWVRNEGAAQATFNCSYALGAPNFTRKNARSSWLESKWSFLSLKFLATSLPPCPSGGLWINEKREGKKQGSYSKCQQVRKVSFALCPAEQPTLAVLRNKITYRCVICLMWEAGWCCGVWETWVQTPAQPLSSPVS